MGRDRKFPHPDDCKPSNPAVFCPAERVLALFNQESGETGKSISQKVRKWFATSAHEQGWVGVHFLTEVQTGHAAGCVLWRPTQQVNLQVEIVDRFVRLQDQADGGDEGEA